MALTQGACLSVVIVVGLAQLEIACLKNFLAATMSLVEESIKSIVHPLLSTALYRYLSLPLTLI